MSLKSFVRYVSVYTSVIPGPSSLLGPTCHKCFVACSSLPARALSTRVAEKEVASTRPSTTTSSTVQCVDSRSQTSTWLILVAQRLVPQLRWTVWVVIPSRRRRGEEPRRLDRLERAVHGRLETGLRRATQWPLIEQQGLRSSLTLAIRQTGSSRMLKESLITLLTSRR